MSTFQILEDLENQHEGKILSKKATLPVKGHGVKKLIKENRGVLEPVTNGVRHDSKRVKLTENTEEKIKQEEKKIKITNIIQIIPDKAVQLKNDKYQRASSSGKEAKIIAKKESKKDDFPHVLLYSTEYKKDILGYLYSLQQTYPSHKPNYMQKQHDLSWNTRSILIDWLANVAEEYKLCNQTLHLSVNYIDRFLSQISVLRTKFQLVGSVAMLLAGKQEEIYPVEVKEWAYLTGDTFTTRQIMKMEQLLIKVLRFRLQPPTMFHFIEYFCSEFDMDTQTLNLAMYLSELVLLEGDQYLSHVPSKLAAAAVALSRYILNKDTVWPSHLKQISGYSIKQLSPVLQKQHQTLEDSPMKTQQAIQSKYKSEKYDRVALLKPKTLDFDLFENE